jgi:hypothetical protein
LLRPCFAYQNNALLPKSSAAYSIKYRFITTHTTIPEKICRSNHPHPLLTHAHIQGLDSIKKKGCHTAAKVYAFGL